MLFFMYQMEKKQKEAKAKKAMSRLIQSSRKQEAWVKKLKDPKEK
tara:strand:+ start:2465 stop:2599 length:135 start_codon:yes stop_codon:yes gene_type:complete